MLTRRILASVCALCLVVPAAAGAKDVRFVGHTHHAVLVATGDTKNDLPGAVAAVLAAFALGGAALVARRQRRAPHMGV